MNAALILSALFNGAWQGTLLCVAALPAFRFFRRLNAATMFAVWSALLAVALLLPVANYVFAPRAVIMQSPSVPAVSAPAVHAAAPVAVAVPRRVAVRSSEPSVREAVIALGRTVFRNAMWLLGALALIALVRLTLLGKDVAQMLLARRRVRRIDAPVALGDAIGRPFAFAASDDFSSPCVLGFAPALIVLPEDLLAEPRENLTSVVLHEREHVRRFDDVQIVLQRLVGAIGFFSPGVRVALRELALYREQICDDAAINATGDRVSYARTLTGMAQWAQGRGAPVPSLIFKRKHLLHRLEVLLDSAVNHSLRMNRRFAVGAVLTLILATALVLRMQVPVVAETVAPPAPNTHVVRLVRHSSSALPKMAHDDNGGGVKGAADNGAAVVAKIVQPRVVKSVRTERRARVVTITRNVVHQRATLAPIVHVREHVAAQVAAAPQSDSLLDALAANRLRGLSVDQLIALRDHGVTPGLITSAVAYFGHVSAQDLVYMMDHGLSPQYIDTIRSSGIRGISPASAVLLMDHGVTANLMTVAEGFYSPRPSPGDLTYLADHGVTANCIQTLQAAGLRGISVGDTVRMFDRGVTDAFILKVRRMNPHATVDEIIRLHDAGF